MATKTRRWTGTVLAPFHGIPPCALSGECSCPKDREGICEYQVEISLATADGRTVTAYLTATAAKEFAEQIAFQAEFCPL